MKKVIYYITFLLLFTNCKENTESRDPICMNEPPALTIIVMNNKMDRKELLYSFKNATQKAMLYKIVDNKKVLVDKRVDISKCHVANGNIAIASAGRALKNFYTTNVETFYLEYNSKVDTLQIKGIYYDDSGCGDNAYLSELYFNHKKIELNLISDHTYLIDNTK